MAKRNKKTNNEADNLNNTWVLTTKRTGDRIGGWVVEKLFDHNTRRLESSERCKITSCCYPSGARMVRARLARDESESPLESLAG